MKLNKKNGCFQEEGESQQPRDRTLTVQPRPTWYLRTNPSALENDLDVSIIHTAARGSPAGSRHHHRNHGYPTATIFRYTACATCQHHQSAGKVHSPPFPPSNYQFFENDRKLTTHQLFYEILPLPCPLLAPTLLRRSRCLAATEDSLRLPTHRWICAC